MSELRTMPVQARNNLAGITKIEQQSRAREKELLITSQTAIPPEARLSGLNVRPVLPPNPSGQDVLRYNAMVIRRKIHNPGGRLLGGGIDDIIKASGGTIMQEYVEGISDRLRDNPDRVLYSVLRSEVSERTGKVNHTPLVFMIDRKREAVLLQGLAQLGVQPQLMSPMAVEEKIDSIPRITDVSSNDNIRQISVRSALETIGETYSVNLGSFWSPRRTMASMLTLAGVRSLGIDLDTVFRGCGGKERFDRERNVNKHGILIRLDFYQQTALLKAICEKVPAIAARIGFYNLKGSRKVYEVLNRAKVDDNKDIWWFYTGEKYKDTRDQDQYAEEGLVRAGEIGRIEGSRFCCRFIGSGGWFSHDPEYCDNPGAPVVGGFI